MSSISNGSKILTIGERGMLVIDREYIYHRVLFLRDHGRRPGDKMFWNTEVAYKYKMSSMQAALGFAQLERIEELITYKRQIFEWYKQELSSVNGIMLNHEAAGTKNTYWMVTVILDETFRLSKERLMALLSEYHIDSRPFFFPLNSLPAYEHLEQARVARQRNRVSYQISPYGVNLPSGLNMTEEKAKYVCTILKEVVNVHDE